MSITNGFNFGTFNAGTDYKDYRHLILAGKTPEEKQQILSDTTNQNMEIAVVEPQSENTSANVEAHIQDVWERFSEQTTQNLGQVLDVISLQEVKENNGPRKDVQSLRDMGFQIFRPQTWNVQTKQYEDSGKTDTAIAIKSEKFTIIENRSPKGGSYDFTVVVTEEKATGKRIAFVSAHIPGFDIERDAKTMGEYSESEDNDFRRFLETLKTQCSDCDSIVFGGDLNATRETFDRRFKILEDAGFKGYSTDKPTSQFSLDFHGNVPTIQKRELDHVFIFERPEPQVSKFRSVLNNLFKKKEVKIVQLHNQDAKLQMSLDPISNSSDHLPVIVRIESGTKKSGINRFFSTLFSPVKSLFGRAKTAEKPASKGLSESMIQSDSQRRQSTDDEIKKRSAVRENEVIPKDSETDNRT